MGIFGLDIVLICAVSVSLHVVRPADGAGIFRDYRPWKPLDHGNPMMDDPTLQYMPPAMGHVYFEPSKRSGTESSLWPIKPRIPPFLYKTPSQVPLRQGQHEDRPRSSTYPLLEPNKKVEETVTNVQDWLYSANAPRKNRQGFSMIQFAIQQGHSKVKKYGTQS